MIYHIRETDPAWDGSCATVVDPSALEQPPIAVVEFQGCTSHKFGSPNDEVLHGHPLYGRGLVYYGAHIVERSRWIREIQGINSVHPRYDPASWGARQHYILAFHDETFECIALGYSVESTWRTFREALEDCVEKVLR